MSSLEVQALCHCFPDGSRSLDGVCLSFAAGELAVIVGANGSGKTTLLRHCNGLLLPESGTVLVDGVEVASDPVAARRKVGLVFQDADSQIVGDTVYDDVAFGPENLGLERREVDRRVQAALRDVCLAGCEDKSPQHLSGGEKRRLAIAGVLAMDPQILLLDEPFSNLDYRGTCLVLEQLLELHRRGRTIIVTSHDLEKLIYHADRLVVMEQGRIAGDGPPAEVVMDIERYGIRPPCSVQLGMGIQPWAPDLR